MHGAFHHHRDQGMKSTAEKILLHVARCFFKKEISRDPKVGRTRWDHDDGQSNLTGEHSRASLTVAKANATDDGSQPSLKMGAELRRLHTGERGFSLMRSKTSGTMFARILVGKTKRRSRSCTRYFARQFKVLDIADALTKELPRPSFRKCTEKIGMWC